MDYMQLKKVRLELCTICQLDCRDCYMRKGNYCAVGKGYVSFENFKRFLDMNPFIEMIETSNSGEIFLNPDLEKIMEYAFNKNVILSAENGVNLNFLTDELAEALVKYKFRSITVSIDGASQTVYSAYRRNGNYNSVIENIKKIIYYKQKYNSQYPKLQWQYVVMDTNDDIKEIENAKKTAEELGMDIFFKKTWNRSYIPKDIEKIKKETGLDYSERIKNDG